MRRYGVPDAYEQLKDLTRGRAIDRDTLREFIASSTSRATHGTRLLELTPSTYTGLAARPRTRHLSARRASARAAVLPCDTSRRSRGAAMALEPSLSMARIGPGSSPYPTVRFCAAVRKTVTCGHSDCEQPVK